MVSVGISGRAGELVVHPTTRLHSLVPALGDIPGSTRWRDVRRCRVPSVGFLHTSLVHEPTFTAQLEDAAGAHAVDQVHCVDETLLADARSHGIDSVLQERIRAHLHRLADQVDVIVCTCSTISGAAEQLAEEDGIVFVRVDRPMAERAIAVGGRIGVAAAVASTIGPTRTLLLQVGGAAGVEAEIVDIDCTTAWTLFEQGDMSAYFADIARSVRLAAVATPFDGVVLAQASMAGAAALLAGEPYPVLSSPKPAVERALALASR